MKKGDTITLEKCIDCHSLLYITSIIPDNGQVNFVCSGDCGTCGFIHNAKVYFQVKDEKIQTP